MVAVPVSNSIYVSGLTGDDRNHGRDFTAPLATLGSAIARSYGAGETGIFVDNSVPITYGTLTTVYTVANDSLLFFGWNGTTQFGFTFNFNATILGRWIVRNANVNLMPANYDFSTTSNQLSLFSVQNASTATIQGQGTHVGNGKLAEIVNASSVAFFGATGLPPVWDYSAANGAELILCRGAYVDFRAQTNGQIMDFIGGPTHSTQMFRIYEAAQMSMGNARLRLRGAPTTVGIQVETRSTLANTGGALLDITGMAIGISLTRGSRAYVHDGSAITGNTTADIRHLDGSQVEVDVNPVPLMVQVGPASAQTAQSY